MEKGGSLTNNWSLLVSDSLKDAMISSQRNMLYNIYLKFNQHLIMQWSEDWGEISWMRLYSVFHYLRKNNVL